MIYQLQAERLERHISLEKAAQFCGITEQELETYEQKPWTVSRLVLKKLSKLYAVSPYCLLGMCYNRYMEQYQ
jgi:transcriptional regulator with XRE-family HTH domain